MPAWLVPAITAAASLAGNLFNINSTRKTNQAQQDVNSQLYDKQRADALTDWNKQNAYNSPSQQMQRFKEAGLNPNLVYGQMTNAPVVRSAEAKAPDFVAPRLDTQNVGNILGSYYDIKSKELSLKQQEKAIEIANEDLKYKQRANTLGNSILPFQTEAAELKNRKLKEDIQNTILDWTNKKYTSDFIGPRLEQMEQQTENLKTNNEYLKSQLEINKVIKDSKLAEIALTGAKLEGQNLDNKVKNLELRLRDLNLSPNLISDIIRMLVSAIIK